MELSIKEINKHYKKKHALKDFSCVFHEGVNVLLGPNGAGKTTLMNGIADIINLDNGDIYFDGVETLKMGREFRKKLGYLPQNPEFYPFFTGKQAIKMLRWMKCTYTGLINGWQYVWFWYKNSTYISVVH